MQVTKFLSENFTTILFHLLSYGCMISLVSSMFKRTICKRKIFKMLKTTIYMILVSMFVVEIFIKHPFWDNVFFVLELMLLLFAITAYIILKKFKFETMDNSISGIDKNQNVTENNCSSFKDNQ